MNLSPTRSTGYFGRRTLSRARLLAGCLLWLALAPIASGAGAQTTAEQPAAELTRSGLQVERVRLRAELDRVNAEIDAMKRGQRGVRDDYRLRTRLADAEAIARRLTEIETRITRLEGAAANTTAPIRLGAEPGAAPTDGPAELEAKADILADQSRRLEAQAETLTVRVTQLKSRQELRRRAGQLERDPFAPLEGSKRRAITGTQASSLGGAGPTIATPGANRAPGAGAAPPTDTTTPPSVPGNGISGAPAPGPAPAAGNKDPSFGPAGAAPGGSRGLTGGTFAPTPTTTSGGAPATESGTSLSSQLRDVLDAGVLAEIRRLEGNGAPGSNVAAMERAIAALKARAERLQAQSKALRPTKK